jgi:hypothetical protein
VTVGVDVKIGGTSEALAETISLVLQEFLQSPRDKWERAIGLGIEIEDWLAVLILESLVNEHGDGLSDELKRVH